MKDLNLIVAMTQNGVIGLEGKLPWHIPEDMKLFKEITIGNGKNAVIMGRNTYDLIGKPLENRTNIVVSNSLTQADIPNKKYAGTILKPSFDAAMRFINLRYNNTFLIGGSRIYEEGLPLVSTMYISLIKKEYDGNIYFPKFDKDEWNIEKLSEHEEFDLLKYTRK
jgi:dihydrofolate reductase